MCLYCCWDTPQKHISQWKESRRKWLGREQPLCLCQAWRSMLPGVGMQSDCSSGLQLMHLRTHSRLLSKALFSHVNMHALSKLILIGSIASLVVPNYSGTSL